jgi:putative intracellular protease/amidase
MASPVAVLVFDGFADWEPAFALTGLRRWGSRTVTSVGYDRRTVTSMGGLRIQPDDLLESLTPGSTDLLILPGGDAWLESYPAPRVDKTLEAFATFGVPIAAICAATVALARAGLFAGRRHTSNGASFLQRNAPGYETPQLYVDTLAVVDRGVITASGLGAIEFAHEIFALLQIFGESDRQLYLDMYRGGRRPPEP